MEFKLTSLSVEYAVKKKLSIAIVIFNPDIEELINNIQQFIPALEACSNKSNYSTLLYIIDNSTENNHVEKLIDNLKILFSSLGNIEFQYHPTGKNLGYGCANNTIIEKLDSDYHLIMNPDVYFSEDTLVHAIEFLDSQGDVGLLSPSIYSPKGELQHLCKQNPTFFITFLRRFAPSFLKELFKKALDHYEMRHMDYSEINYNIPFLSGCFMLFRTSIFKQLEGFDPRFFLYFEDADITRRCVQIAKTVYYPKIKIIHSWSRGAYKNKKLRNLAIKSGLQYCAKWFWRKK